jgi:serine/threonine protein kinase
MKKKKKFTEEEAIEYFTMILLGLDFLHSKSIFHRDLKPGNIFVDKFENGKRILKIGDFGISRHDLKTMKQTNTSFGFSTTLAYKAPEVINM